jgi:hypothetical protein
MIEERMTRGRDRTHRDVRSELSNMPFVLMVPVPNERVSCDFVPHSELT